ncbi:MAG: hypothetical protein ROY99_07425 [Ignavibacterium sp.]|jgi:hypothetical protein|nr:hypothetical protein [Ignavibacterium sp.]
MKANLLVLILISLLTFTTAVFPQGEVAIPFLIINPSPSNSAMGGTGTALPTDDPFGFLWNPAQLGHTSQTNNLSFIFYPTEIKWVGLAPIKLTSLAFNAGYNFRDLIGVPLSLGLGYSNVKLKFGEFVITGSNNPEPLGTYRPEDSYHAYSFGLGLDFGAQLSIGYSIKDINSFFADTSPHPDSGEVRAKNKVNDFGILINVPVIKLINDKVQISFNEEIKAYPTFNISLGYSKSNIGDSLQYSGIPQSSPLPRVERIGYGISTGFDLAIKDFRFNAFNLSFTSLAEDFLVSVYHNSWEYQDDLDFWDNVILIKGNNKIISRVGTKLDFAETFSFSFGHFSGRGFPDPQKTTGYEINTRGLLKLCAFWTKHPVLDFISNHLEIRYYNTNYYSETQLETKMTGLAFYLRNLNSLF